MRPGLSLLLPIFALWVLYRFFRKQLNWREALLATAIACGSFVALSTEVLSVYYWITPRGLSLAWVGLLLMGLFAQWKFPIASFSEDSPSSKSAKTDCLRIIDVLLLLGVGLIALLVGLTAILSPPNTWDAMEYHMPRVVLWASNHTVRFFPTIDYSQLIQAPFAEYCMLHLYVLTGSDRFVNLVQFLSWICGMIGVSLMAQSLGASIRGQVLSVVACATLPTTILAASGPKNDCVGTLCVVATVYYLLSFSRRPSIEYLLGASLAMSLAFLSKGTAYIFLSSLTLVCWLIAPAGARIRLLKWAPFFAVLILLFNAPQYVRNHQLSGSPFGFSSPFGNGAEYEGRRFRVGKISISGSVGNLIRHVALNFGTPSDALNAWETREFGQLIRLTGSDPDERSYIEDRESGTLNHFRVPPFTREEVLAGDPIHLGLFLCAAVLLLAGIPARRWDLIIFVCGIFGAFVLFCVLLRWQPSNVRYLMPVLVLACTVIGTVFGSVSYTRAVALGAAMLFLACLPFVLANKTRPLLTIGFHTSAEEANYYGSRSILFAPRSEMYFWDYHLYLAQSYRAAAVSFRNRQCSDVALDSSLQRFDYPMLALLKREGQVQKFRYAGVKNLSAEYSIPNDLQPPCAIVCLNCAGNAEKFEEYRQKGWLNSAVYGGVVVFQRLAEQ